MQYMVVEDYSHPELDWVGDLRFIFITGHRRENLGEPMHNMFRAMRRVLDEHPDVKAIWEAADEELDDEAEYEKMTVWKFYNVFFAHSYWLFRIIVYNKSAGSNTLYTRATELMLFKRYVVSSAAGDAVRRFFCTYKEILIAILYTQSR